ncbi:MULTISPECIES: hypothetical protein [Streptomyces]|uniref:Uncharacterized protein n=1 Tax=Streptomyces griseiscabiei TaxID=2993540 RepID=A0ABU4LM87_9ACTN|nr:MULTISPECIES: hypothetical protein [Streptomyces]MBP5866088.1 hypothetical protein [Streptomyces sp. LBUM 1484]MBP5880774.1 hypothetical protein [Streptomyces sp. LBUM 1477]MBZ3908828.1 hypothetical protein [Streptomyces griseiscabiei]MDX2567511.1 hypothetical protein [Streptomyces scabiei]MDX2916103.1 hypothetical protein [Streptomyces griseiscabiei]
MKTYNTGVNPSTGLEHRLACDLEEALTDLGAVLGAALVALDSPEVAIAQLTGLLALAKKTAKERDIELAPHWRMADVLLAAKTTTTTPADDTPAGGTK